MSAENKAYITNNHSILSKYSAIKNSYFEDDLLKLFIENTLNISKGWRRTPLVNRGYAARLLAIDWAVSRCIKNESIDCVVVLGAGYDTLAFRNIIKSKSTSNKSTCWIEIDLPKVVEMKAKFVNDNNNNIIISNDDGETKLKQDGNIYSSMNYHLISCDLKDATKLASSLHYVVTLKINRKLSKIMILNEVCLCYLDLKYIKSILQTVIKAFQKHALRIHYVGYEQLKPNSMSQMNEIMLAHFQALGHPLNYFPTSNDIKDLFTNFLNFNHVTISSMFEIYHNVLASDKLNMKGFSDEVFDEFEEMDLYISHYALVTGVLILKDPFLNEILNNTNRLSNLNLDEDLKIDGFQSDYCDKKKAEFIKSNIKRYAHASCVLDCKSLVDPSCEDLFFVTGGFGTILNESCNNSDMNYQHRRLHVCEIIRERKVQGASLAEGDGRRYESINMDLSKFPNDSVCLDRMHGQIQHLGMEVSNERKHLIFFNGGRQSPIKHDSKNINFIGSINCDNYQLQVEHQFKEDVSTLVWRHKMKKINSGDSLYQVGGIYINNFRNSPVIRWNFSSSKLGFEPIEFEDTNIKDTFQRHSFGMDINNSKSTILIVGGLMSCDQHSRDRLCDDEVILYDLRANMTSTPKVESAKGYGTNVILINDYQFFKTGGLSAKGLFQDAVELIDLRNFKTVEKFDTYLTKDNAFIEYPVTLTNSSAELLQSKNELWSIGGGGNYFTFGSKFSSCYMKLKYST